MAPQQFKSNLNRPVRRPAAVLAITAAAILGGLHIAPALAQQGAVRIVSGGFGGMGGAGRSAMNQKELDGYAAILAWNETQAEAAKELLASYTAEFEKASKEQGEKMRRISEEFRETRDDEVWEQMGPIAEKFSKRSKELESTLISDIKSLCDDKQLTHWPKFERARRRDRTIDRGTVSGESVDLVRIVRALELKGEAQANVAPQIESYELDLDKALVDRNKIVDEQAAAFTPGRGRVEFDMDAWQKQMRDAREAGAKIRDINQRYARSIETLLPESLRSRFQMDVKRASFPVVYKQSRTQRSFEAALKFDDLDVKQREAIASLSQSYEQDASTLNDKWVGAIMEEEKDDTGGSVIGGGGAVVMMNFGDQDAGPTADAKKARREADKKALKNLEALLTDAQKERLPQLGDEPSTGGVQILGGSLSR